MEKIVGKKRPVINLSIFATLPRSFSSEKPMKSPRNFEGGVVGLGIVAAMTDSNPTHFSAKFSGVAAASLSLSPRSSPIPIQPQARAAGGKVDSDGAVVVDELSESYTCVISHIGNSSVKKRVYFDDKMKKVLLDDCSAMFSASPLNFGGEVRSEFGAADFLSCCYLCNKQLQGLDIFMYRGEKAFCSSDCRDKHIRVDKRKEKCRSEAMKPLEFSVSPCPGPMLAAA